MFMVKKNTSKFLKIEAHKFSGYIIELKRSYSIASYLRDVQFFQMFSVYHKPVIFTDVAIHDIAPHDQHLINFLVSASASWW